VLRAPGDTLQRVNPTVLSVCAVAEVAGYDASGQTLHVQALCENQERPTLAAGDFYLRAE
jgi:hypothetical protein